MMRPLHPLLRGHTDRTFSEYLADRSPSVQRIARECRICLMFARERVKDATNTGIAEAYTRTANAIEDELVSLLHATRPEEVIPFPEPPKVVASHTLDELMTRAEPKMGRVSGFLRFCTDLLPGGRDVH